MAQLEFPLVDAAYDKNIFSFPLFINPNRTKLVTQNHFQLSIAAHI